MSKNLRIAVEEILVVDLVVEEVALMRSKQRFREFLWIKHEQIRSECAP